MLDDYEKNQRIPHKILSNAIKKNKISHAYFFVSNGYPKVLDFALAFAKCLFCPYKKTNKNNCNNCNQCKTIEEGNFSEIKIIEPDGLWIKKDQLIDLQEEFNKKAIVGDQKIYIINHAECLNSIASNSILKFLEEPNDNITAILIADNSYQLLDTIVSRCQTISMNKMYKEEKSVYENAIQNKIAFTISTNEEEINKYSSEEYCDKINSAMRFIENYEKKGLDMLLDSKKMFHNIFNDKEDVIYAFNVFLLLYKDILNIKCNRKIEIFNDYINTINNISDNNSRETIINKIDSIINAKSKVYVNANINLLLDKLIIDMEGGVK